LWRLVGSLVRLAIELGLHHDPTTQINPTTQQPLFTEREQLMRIRLWGIVIVHDRGTSILLGRPLAIAPSDSNTPAPRVRKDADGNVIDVEFSPHFEHSSPIAEIQADIINSLYCPNRQDKATIMRHATRIIKKFHEFRKSMPEKYQYYFGGTEDWTLERKSKLVKEITEDEGLTLLKIGIARILLLRALFSSKELPYEQRRQALVDGASYIPFLSSIQFTISKRLSLRTTPSLFITNLFASLRLVSSLLLPRCTLPQWSSFMVRHPSVTAYQKIRRWKIYG
jgi:hypothetical protein